MSQTHVDIERFNDLKRFFGAYMSALSDQIAALQTVVTSTTQRVQGDIANLHNQLAAVQANAGSQFTATDLANLQSLQTQIAAIDTPPAPALIAPAPVTPAPAVLPILVPQPVDANGVLIPTPPQEVPASTPSVPVAPVEPPTPAPAAS